MVARLYFFLGCSANIFCQEGSKQICLLVGMPYSCIIVMHTVLLYALVSRTAWAGCSLEIGPRLKPTPAEVIRPAVGLGLGPRLHGVLYNIHHAIVE